MVEFEGPLHIIYKRIQVFSWIEQGMEEQALCPPQLASIPIPYAQSSVTIPLFKFTQVIEVFCSCSNNTGFIIFSTVIYLMMGGQ